MPRTFTAEVRLTHTYIDQYSHLDQWGEPYTFTEYTPKRVSEGNGYDDRGKVKFLVKGNSHLDSDPQMKALRSYYGYSGCTHEYDCCGCASVSASVSKVRPGLFSVLLHETRNY